MCMKRAGLLVDGQLNARVLERSEYFSAVAPPIRSVLLGTIPSVPSGIV
jgi:hypothetical protein